MKRRIILLLAAAIVAILLWKILPAIWARTRILVFINIPWWLPILLVLGLVAVVFLALDHLINRTR